MIGVTTFIFATAAAAVLITLILGDFSFDMLLFLKVAAILLILDCYTKISEALSKA